MKVRAGCLLIVLMFGSGFSAAEPVEVRECRIQPDQEVLLACDRPGVLSAVEPQEGDRVEAGQLVARLIDDAAAAIVAVAEKEATNDIDLRYAQKASELATLEHERSMRANSQNLGTFPELEVRKLKLAAERGALAVEQAHHQLAVNRLRSDESRAQLQTYRVVSPVAGFVTRVFKSPGEAVQLGDPIVEIVNTTQVRVEGFVGVEHRRLVRPGTRVDVYLDVAQLELEGEGVPLAGRIEFVDVIVQPVTRQVRVWALVDNPDDVLLPGLTARMVIHAGEIVPADDRSAQTAQDADAS